MKLPPPELLGISANEIAQIAQVDLSTARRWKRGAICPPKAVLLLLSGDLGMFDPEWSGWILRRGCLISPEGWEIRMADVLASRLHEAQLAAYHAESRRLKAELEQARCPIKDEQPTPESWDLQNLVG